MKRIALFILFVFITYNISNAQLLFSEGFTGYTVGNLAGQSNWTKVGTGPDCTVNNVSPMSYPGFSWGGGEYMEFTTNSSTTSRVYKDFADTTASLITPGYVIYCAMLLNLSTTFTTATNYFFSLGQAPGTTNYYAKLFAQQITSSTYYLGVSKSSNTANFSTKVLNTGQTYLVVIRYNVNNNALNQSGNTCYMWINPVGSSEPDTTTADAKVWAGQNDYTSAHCSAVIWHNRGTSNPLGKLDGIRVGASATSSLQAWNYVNLGPLPVEFTTFNAKLVENKVKLNWATATETNNSGFNVERKINSENWQTIGFIKGKGTTTSTNFYSFVDEDVVNKGVATYRLRQIDYNGTYSYSKEVEVDLNSVLTYSLNQNYPNPFNPSTSIGFSVAKAGYVKLNVYNLIGQKVQTLVDGFLPAGFHKVNFNAANLNSGFYFYKIETDNFTQIRKMTLMK